MIPMPKRASGEGSLRQRANGRWEGRFCAGRDPATGKLIRKSIYAPTQSEARRKLREATAQVETGVFQEPSKMTFGEWLDIWLENYCLNVKPATLQLYSSTVHNRLSPNLGAVPLQKLTPLMIQNFVKNAVQGNLRLPPPNPDAKGYSSRTKCRQLSSKTIKNVVGILHKSLDVAVQLEYLHSNPANNIQLPRIEKQEIQPLPENLVAAFTVALADDFYRLPILVDLFTGLRQSELVGLEWNDIDFAAGIITVRRQLQLIKGEYIFSTTKNSKPRQVAPAPFVFDFLREQQTMQDEWKAAAGRYWGNADDLVFTNELGEHIVHRTLYQHMKAAAIAVGCPNLRFHDLRHTFAVYSLESGSDVKNVQSALGHYSAAFTLDQYCTVTENMQQRNAQRMQQFVESLISKKADSQKQN